MSLCLIVERRDAERLSVFGLEDWGFFHLVVRARRLTGRFLKCDAI